MTALLGAGYGGSSSNPGFFGCSFDAQVYGLLAGFVGLLVAPFVGFFVARRSR